MTFMAVKARALVLCLAAICLPAFANIPRASLVAENSHQGSGSFAQASHRAKSTANALIAPGCADACTIPAEDPAVPARSAMPRPAPTTSGLGTCLASRGGLRVPMHRLWISAFLTHRAGISMATFGTTHSFRLTHRGKHVLLLTKGERFADVHSSTGKRINV